jgi:hypothetical protein
MAKNIKVSTTEKFISSFSGSVPDGTVFETLGYSTAGVQLCKPEILSRLVVSER